MKILVRSRRNPAASDLVVRPARVTVPARPMRVLDFDVEARPLHWINDEYVSKEITAIAWAWCDEPDHVVSVLLGEWPAEAMLTAFRAAYDQADMVTGHYIRGYDLPMLNGAMTEYELPPLDKKLTQDTKLDLVKRAGLSGSQENIGSMLGLAHDKVSMNQTRWRAANRLTPEGLAIVRQRVVGDVQQHIEMRTRLLELGYLGNAVLWKPGGTAKQSAAYTP